MATAGGALSTAWNATKWSARNLTPIGKTGRLVWTIGGATALALTLAAPPIAFATAAQGITASSGIGSYMGAGMDIAWEGAKTVTKFSVELAQDDVWGEVAQRITSPS